MAPFPTYCLVLFLSAPQHRDRQGYRKPPDLNREETQPARKQENEQTGTRKPEK